MKMLIKELGVQQPVAAFNGGLFVAPDLLMFARSGTSIAMANANLDVQRAATFVTSSNTEEGFALAMQRWVLPRAHRTRSQMPDGIAPRSVAGLS
jgi:hydroxymethylpyrimidine pyrophosphatase-like HAD family hydrolase